MKLEIDKSDFFEVGEIAPLNQLGVSNTCAKCPDPTKYFAIKTLYCNGVSIGQVKVSLCKNHFDKISFSCLHEWKILDEMYSGGHDLKLWECSKCHELKAGWVA